MNPKLHRTALNSIRSIVVIGNVRGNLVKVNNEEWLKWLFKPCGCRAGAKDDDLNNTGQAQETRPVENSKVRSGPEVTV